MRGKARPGWAAATALQQKRRQRTMLLAVSLHVTQTVTLSTGSKKLEEKIFYNHNKQLIHLFFFHI